MPPGREGPRAHRDVTPSGGANPAQTGLSAEPGISALHPVSQCLGTLHRRAGAAGLVSGSLYGPSQDPLRTADFGRPSQRHPPGPLQLTYSSD